MNIQKASELIKEEALRLGFSACGFCPAESTGAEALYFENWLHKGFHGGMSFMGKNLEKRFDPRLLFDGVKSMIVVALNYYPAEKQVPESPQFSYYAYGKDYHIVVKEKLKELYTYINTHIFPVEGRIFCDSAPVMEKYHAMKAGLGWIGKNTQLIIPDKGSYFFLGEILINRELVYDTPYTKNGCGACNKCMEACPTHALEFPNQLNAKHCLSYLSIEYHGDLPDFYDSAAGNQVYGCDICNKVCPWNKYAEANHTEAFHPSAGFLELTFDSLKQMEESAFNEMFKYSPVARIGLQQLKRNIRRS